jgi:hypothetical protein
MNLFRKKKENAPTNNEPSLSELFERYNKRVYAREEMRYEMLKEAAQLEQRRKSGREYIQ